MAPNLDHEMSPVAQQPSSEVAKDLKRKEVAFTCTWPDCKETKTFTRNSDFSKHMDKHTRPYTCTNPSCNAINFGDKAGLLRHERERHGAARYFCPTPSCTRHRRGFARKRNLDAHLASRHNSTFSTLQAVSKSPESEKELEGVEEETAEVDSVSELGGLKAKLCELEMRKEELAASQMKVDEDIRALKRTMELVATA